MSGRLLSIYLQDHHAGAVGGTELAKRSLEANRGTEFEATLSAVAAEIEEDRRSLVDVMKRLGVSPSTWKNSALWAAEKLGRLKMNGQVSGYSPLSRLLELEALRAGVVTKVALWRTLERLKPGIAALSDVDLEHLISRGEGQVARLDDLHARASTQLVPR